MFTLKGSVPDNPHITDLQGYEVHFREQRCTAIRIESKIHPKTPSPVASEHIQLHCYLKSILLKNE